MLGNCCDRPEIDRYHCPMVERVIGTSLSELLVGIDFLDYASQKRRPKLRALFSRTVIAGERVSKSSARRFSPQGSLRSVTNDH
jgi:hypothetical protein